MTQDAKHGEPSRPALYPFAAIVGQEELKKSLILNVINPGLSGVLIRGEKGTAKSTAVRALADLLPEIEVVDGDPFQSDPRDPRAMAPEIYARHLLPTTFDCFYDICAGDRPRQSHECRHHGARAFAVPFLS